LLYILFKEQGASFFIGRILVGHAFHL